MFEARFQSFDESAGSSSAVAREGHRLVPRDAEGEASGSILHVALTDRPWPDGETTSAARAFMRRLSASGAMFDAILFGSRARGDHGLDSDADIAVVLAGEAGERYRVAGRMAEIAFDVLLETGIMIDPLPLWQTELDRPEAFRNPTLLAAIAREGVLIR